MSSSSPTTSLSEAEQKSITTVQDAVEQSLETLRQMALLTVDVQEGTQGALIPKVKSLVSSLDAMDREKGNLERVPVPWDVIGLIDKGELPDEFTREKLEAVNMRTSSDGSKVQTFQDFRQMLLDELKKDGFQENA
eukprot:m.121306 g.121306  ORF g.121306 m.121306 type:complete len:136 (+) comp14387_c0_seq4:570-977(+)